MDVIILFFLFGLAAGLLRSELRLPAALYDFLSIVLLLAIGLKGGVELAKQPFVDLLPQILAVIAMGIVLPLTAYPALRHLGKFKRADAASIAAHYGSVSVGTYAVAIAYLGSRHIGFEPHMPLLLVVLEVPAILIGIILARGIDRQTQWGDVAHEVLLGKGVVLLLGGLLIGWLAGPEGLVSIEPFFFDLFQGVLALFLLEMGLLTASQFGSLRRHGLFILGFGVIMPLYSGLVGTLLGCLLGLSVGGTTILAILAASASYIAVPAAMRISVPEANPTLSLSASLGVTFPFNVLFGIPICHMLAVYAHNLLGG
ncbi:sodium-dependent bicarbonate transport family permease [Desulfobulbus alkaliphilus]|uniref:sodium-dependent bicarbonate transport family permease n=1 Tax=Desulfobulbus alkaliphilus TaxID=869814 RepID=UPI00196448D1|nr:sodium-dependent bicarbonate transport family permease [Desulfobulbus alkaliphilus]MBM9535638.1 sodium-dependent bicarbonate transport family permease [Desulfobulbus alkaliphilus]